MLFYDGRSNDRLTNFGPALVSIVETTKCKKESVNPTLKLTLYFCFWNDATMPSSVGMSRSVMSSSGYGGVLLQMLTYVLDCVATTFGSGAFGGSKGLSGSWLVRVDCFRG